MDAYDIAPRLQAAVTRSGLRKAEIARRADITWAQLYKALTGARPHISAETVRALALALDVSADYLLGLTDEPRAAAARDQTINGASVLREEHTPRARPPRPRRQRTPRAHPADVLAQWADAVQGRHTGDERTKRA